MAKLKRAAFDATVTVPDGSEEGVFEALVAVFGNVDSQGDVIDPGAFVDTLAEWVAKDDPIPVIWSHMWEDPFAHLGEVLEAEETAEGLWIKGQLDLTNPTAMQVYKLLKRRRVTQWSFVAQCPDGGWTLVSQEDGSVVCHLQKLDLIEVGPTLRGANTETTLISIKSELDGLLVEKEGRVLAQKHVDTLKTIESQLAEIITAVDKASPPDADEEEKKASELPGPFVLPAVRAKAIAALAAI